MICPYCQRPAKLVKGDDIYPNRPDLYQLNFYSCKECDAYVGCHKNTTAPLGTMANRVLRSARKIAHEQFDVLWKEGEMSRTSAYKLLSELMCIPPDKTHIAMFTFEQCLQLENVMKGRSK